MQEITYNKYTNKRPLHDVTEKMYSFIILIFIQKSMKIDFDYISHVCV